MGEKIKILCYGDSNTWGYIPGTDHQRFSKDERWPGALQRMLGDKYEIIEEGLNSRTLVSVDKRRDREGRSGAEYLLPCLDTHDPIDLVIIMLGTNELKTEFYRNPKEIGEIFEEQFVKKIISRKSVCIQNMLVWLVGFIAYRWLMGVDTILGNTLPDMVITIVLSVIVSLLLGKKND